MEISKFGFFYNVDRTVIVASNGPVTAVFNVVPGGLKLDAKQTNIRADHPNTANLALHVARWHRQNQGVAS